MPKHWYSNVICSVTPGKCPPSLDLRFLMGEVGRAWPAGLGEAGQNCLNRHVFSKEAKAKNQESPM